MSILNPAKLGALLKKHAVGPSVTLPERVAARDPIDSLVFAFLLWEASTAEAVEGWTKLRHSTVDDNDLRISLPFEIVEMLGARYPRGLERAERLRASLNDIYRREHAVTLARLNSMGKREQRAYIESLEGMAPFVAARMLLTCYGVHGIPIDDRLCLTLVEAGAFAEGSDPNEVSATLGRQVKADQAETVHLALLAIADNAGGAKPKGAARSSRRGGADSGSGAAGSTVAGAVGGGGGGGGGAGGRRKGRAASKGGSGA